MLRKGIIINLLIMLFFVANILSRTGPSILSSKQSENLFSGHGSPMNDFLLEKFSGGIKRVSVLILSAFSSIVGISLANKGLANSKHGFVFTSIKYGLNSSHIMKSRPNTSIVLSLRFGSSLPWQALKTSIVNLFIYGTKSLSKHIC